MPLARSEMCSLKLGCAPLRILLPDREIRQGGVRSVGAMRCRTIRMGLCELSAPFILFSLTLLCPYFSLHLPCCDLILLSLTLLCPYFSSHLSYPAVPFFA